MYSLSFSWFFRVEPFDAEVSFVQSIMRETFLETG